MAIGMWWNQDTSIRRLCTGRCNLGRRAAAVADLHRRPAAGCSDQEREPSADWGRAQGAGRRPFCGPESAARASRRPARARAATAEGSALGLAGGSMAKGSPHPAPG